MATMIPQASLFVVTRRHLILPVCQNRVTVVTGYTLVSIRRCRVRGETVAATYR